MMVNGATRARKEIWECQVPQGTKVPLVYQAYRESMASEVTKEIQVFLALRVLQ